MSDPDPPWMKASEPGPLEVTIGATTDGKLVLDFGRPIQTLVIPIAEADELARRILRSLGTVRATKRRER